jgi:hypothetical protein
MLNAEMYDPEVLSPRRGEGRFADGLIHAAPAPLADGTYYPQRDVNRVALVEEWPCLVRCASSLALRWTPGARPLAAVRLEQRQLLRLPRSLPASGHRTLVDHLIC